MAVTQHEKVREAIENAIEAVKYNVPDGRRRSVTHTKLQEALLWFESDGVLADLA